MWDKSEIDADLVNEWAKQRVEAKQSGVAPHLKIVKEQPAAIAA
jgi:hypothetical protein